MIVDSLYIIRHIEDGSLLFQDTSPFDKKINKDSDLEWIKVIMLIIIQLKKMRRALFGVFSLLSI